MLVGHFAVALAAKKVEPRASLGLLFLAVQFADILFFPLILIGIETATVIPDLTESSHFELDSAPYSHGMVGALVASAVAYVGVRYFYSRQGVRSRTPIIIAVAIFSHWVLDVIVHTPDMAILGGDESTIGLGLWKSSIGTYLFEALILIGGLWLYMKATTGSSRVGRFGMIGYVAFMLLFNVYNLFQPAPAAESTVESFAVPAIVGYLVFVGIAFWLDRKRVAISSVG